jgi:hypothetical protein
MDYDFSLDAKERIKVFYKTQEHKRIIDFYINSVEKSNSIESEYQRARDYNDSCISFAEKELERLQIDIEDLLDLYYNVK